MTLVINLLRMQFLIGDDPHRNTADASIPADHSFAVLRLVLIESAPVHNAGQNLLHVIRPGWRGIIDTVNFLRRQNGWLRLSSIPRRLPSIAPLFHDSANACQAGFVIGLAKIYRTADSRMHSCASQLVRR